MARFEREEISAAAFCRREGISQGAFYAWRKRLAAEPEAAFDPPPAPDGFRAVRLTTALAAASLTAVLPGGTRLKLAALDAAALHGAILALAQAERAGGDAC
jgi:hypothetical protein